MADFMKCMTPFWPEWEVPQPPLVCVLFCFAIKWSVQSPYLICENIDLLNRDILSQDYVETVIQLRPWTNINKIALFISGQDVKNRKTMTVLIMTVGLIFRVVCTLKLPLWHHDRYQINALFLVQRFPNLYRLKIGRYNW